MGDVIAGYTEIDTTKFVFYLSDFLLTLILMDGEIPKKMRWQQYKLKKLKGKTSLGKEICFFDLSLYSNLSDSSCQTNISSYVLGKYIKELHEIDSFTTLTFSGNIVDKYFSPSRKLNMQKIFEKCEWCFNTIYLKPSKDIDFAIDVDTHLKMKFSVAGPSLPGQYSGEIGKLKSYLSLSTDTEWNLDDLLDLYRSIYHLFAFFNFRRNITFDEVTLSKRNDDDKLEPVGTLFIATDYSCTNVHAIDAVVHSEIQDKIVKLYLLLHDLEKHLSFIPENDDKAHILDYSTYIVTSAVFEKIYHKCYDNASSKCADPDRLAVREQIISAIKDIISGSTGKMKEEATEYLSAFKRLGEGTLGKRFSYALESNLEVLKQVFPKPKLDHDRVNEIAEAFKRQRHKLAHGEFEYISPLSITPYTYAVCLIYIMILKLIEIDEETITQIIKKMFWNYNHE